MFKIKYLGIIIGCLSLFMACKSKPTSKNEMITANIDSLLETQYQKLLEYRVDSLAFPRSMSSKTEVIRGNGSKDWTSGFFPGSLWLLYQLTENKEYMEKAIEWTAFMEKEKYNDKSHDTGFMIYCSFGSGLKAIEKKEYQSVIIEAARSLSKRFNNNVGSILSWDFGKDLWQFPVIIDNMMNLELLFEATKISGDSMYHQLAVQHANTTLKNHFRVDNSTHHVVDYDTLHGTVRNKMTHQGFNDESSWARGQAWAIYGFTMTYRYTKDSLYLAQAEATAAYYLEHKNLPEDGIPYWDFKDPDIPNAPRDVSASAIVASAFFELYAYTENKKYVVYSQKVLKSLKSEKYILENIEAPFILDSSTGNWPANDEIDGPIVYGDYYFLEAMLREKRYKSN
ncbi:MAG: glycoside hydrolase family 88 protein [Flavobacteriaceae bacterium]